MKKILFLLSMLLTILFSYSQAPDAWIQKANFGGNVRFSAVGFSIGNKGYVGTGTDIAGALYKDLWEYDPSSDSWSQKADFGGIARFAAIGFGIGSKGYIGTGDNAGNYFKDFWEYDPVTNNWSQKADFGGGGRTNATGFNIDNKGYLGTGANGFDYYNDFWEYDPASNAWTRKADFEGNGRVDVVGFSIADEGYIGLGDSPLGYFNDFWQYDPASDKWTQKANFNGSPRRNAIGFSIDNNGYVGTGQEGNNVKHKDFSAYDPTSDKWTRRANFGGSARAFAVAFSIGDKGYLGTGIASDANENTNDFWEYTPPNDTIVIKCQPPTDLKVPFISDTTAVLKWTLPLNPVNGFDIVYHVIGSARIRKRHVTGSTNHIAVGNLLSNTIYRWQMRSDCSTDTTNWINGPDFTTTSSAIASSNAAAIKGNNLSVQILPNPNKGNFTIQMQLPAKAALTTLTVYNSFGIKVWQQDAGMLSGSVSRNIELKSKLPDAYTLIIQYGDTRLIQKFVVNK